MSVYDHNPHGWIFTPVERNKSRAEVMRKVLGENHWPNPEDADYGIAFVAEDEQAYAAFPASILSPLLPAGSVIQDATLYLVGKKVRMVVCRAERHSR